MMDFADKLQGYRKQRGMSQENLAEVIGVSCGKPYLSGNRVSRIRKWIR